MIAEVGDLVIRNNRFVYFVVRSEKILSDGLFQFKLTCSVPGDRNEIQFLFMEPDGFDEDGPCKVIKRKRLGVGY